MERSGAIRSTSAVSSPTICAEIALRTSGRFSHTVTQPSSRSTSSVSVVSIVFMWLAFPPAAVETVQKERPPRREAAIGIARGD
jgi:hypothetical protein